MKQSISGVWLYGIIFAFTLMFGGYLAVSVKYSEAFKIKNSVLWIIETHNGLGFNVDKINSTFHNGVKLNGKFGGLNGVNAYLQGAQYTTKGRCPKETGWYGVKDLSYTKNTAEIASNKTNYFWCFKKSKIDGNSYYKIVIFYKFGLPIFGDMVTFSIEGTTVPIAIVQDTY